MDRMRCNEQGTDEAASFVGAATCRACCMTDVQSVWDGWNRAQRFEHNSKITGQEQWTRAIRKDKNPGHGTGGNAQRTPETRIVVKRLVLSACASCSAPWISTSNE